MIKSVKVTNYLGSSTTFELADPWNTGFAVKSITGIGPQKATINTTEVSTSDGSIYNSARVEERNIVLTLVYLETSDKNVDDLRRELYRIFPVKKQVTLEFTNKGKTETRTSKIAGYVESNENTIFAQNAYAQISIICPDPMFYDTGANATISLNFGKTNPKFQFYAFSETDFDPKKAKFPAENENDFELSEVNTTSEASVVYSGDDDIGVTITFTADGAVTKPALYRDSTNEYIKLDTEMVSGDIIRISTVRGKKTVKRQRNSETTNILNELSSGSSWIQMSYGTNTFTYGAESGAEHLTVNLSYDTIHEGI